MGGDTVFERREALRILGRAAGAAAAVQVLGLAGCGAPPPLMIPISEVPEGRRVRMVWDDRPVEVVRTADGITARSLRCTHQGCEVRFEPRDRRYHCPCHGGLYDADGRVLSGPPPAPLQPVPVKLSGDTVILGAA